MVRHAASDGAKRIRLHVLTDGRDVPDNTGAEYIENLEKDLRELAEAIPGDYKIASGGAPLLLAPPLPDMLHTATPPAGGRMKVTMDRYEADWAMVERGWRAHVLGEAPTTSASAIEAYRALKQGGVSDQNIGPFVVVGADGKPVGAIQDGDAVVNISTFPLPPPAVQDTSRRPRHVSVGHLQLPLRPSHRDLQGLRVLRLRAL